MMQCDQRIVSNYPTLKHPKGTGVPRGHMCIISGLLVDKATLFLCPIIRERSVPREFDVDFRWGAICVA